MLRLLVSLILLSPTITLAETPSKAFSCAQAMLNNTGLELKFELPKTVEELKKADEIEQVREAELLNAVGEEPAAIFLETRERMRKARLNGGDFSYTIFEPVLKRMMIDLAIRTHEKYDAASISRFNQLIQEGHKLLAQGVPYKETMRFSYRYLDALDAIFLKVHAHLSGRFHRDNAEHMFEKILARAPDIVMYPSFKPVGIKYFAKTRGVPFHIVGLHPEGCRAGEPVPFADGYEMLPSEFAWHDIGHIEFMMMRDFEYLESAGPGKPLEIVIEQWDLTRRKIMGFWDSFKADKNMHDAIGLILFEILHERGYQFSYSLLKNQLDTPKWVEILERKLNHGYYDRFPKMNMNQFKVLEPARLALLRFVDESRRAWQRRYADALDAQDLTVKVTHFPKIDYGRGLLQHMEIGRDGETHVLTKTDAGDILAPPIENLTLAQVSPTKMSTLTDSVVRKINDILAAEKGSIPLHKLNGQRVQAQKILIMPDKRILVRTMNGEELPLEEVTAPASKEEFVLNRHVFQLNQVLGNEERKKPLSFTIIYPVNTYFGRLKFGMHMGEETVTVIRRDYSEIVLPLSEVLIDRPLSFDFKQD